jgi:hypothetical protein
MGFKIRLVAFAVVLLAGLGFALKGRLVSAPKVNLPSPVEQFTESAAQAVTQVQEVGQQAQQIVENKPKARPNSMHKCVGGGSVTYTMDDCPPGTKYVEMGGGTVTTMKTNLDGGSSSKSKSSIPNARELLNDPEEAARMQELKDKRMDAIIENRRP